MKKQVIVIHGGDNWENDADCYKFLSDYQIDFAHDALRVNGWQGNLQLALGEEYEVIRPEMPNKYNAKYDQWKLWFEKFFQYFEPEVILVGHSLGGAFLAKYLSENDFPKKIKAVFFVAAAVSDNLPEYKMLDFAPPSDLSRLEKQAETIVLYHSKDDPVVPFDDVNKLKTALPKATVHVFEDRKHFNQPQLPELVRDIKEL